MLSPIQNRVQRVVAGVILDSRFALAGGGALISLGLTARQTNDLDYFSSDENDVALYVPQVIAALQLDGLEVEIAQQSNAFVRMSVSSESERTEVDFGLDARLFPTQVGEFSPVLSSRELAVDKVLAIFGRAAARDFVDLAALTQFFDLESLLNLAKEKDPGFDISFFLQATNRFEAIRLTEFGISNSEHSDLGKEVEIWRSRVREIIRDRTNDLGLSR